MKVRSVIIFIMVIFVSLGIFEEFKKPVNVSDNSETLFDEDTNLSTYLENSFENKVIALAMDDEITLDSVETVTASQPENLNAVVDDITTEVMKAALDIVEERRVKTNVQDLVQKDALHLAEKRIKEEEYKLELYSSSIEDPTVWDKMLSALSNERRTAVLQTMHLTSQDDTYGIQPLSITGKDRELLEALVYGEAGDEGFVGQCLVAQCLRDTMLAHNTTDTAKIIKLYKYTGSTKRGTSQSCKDAVSFIFDVGGFAVKQRIIYFYAPRLVTSKWHETQDFVIEHRGHRFFDTVKWD